MAMTRGCTCMTLAALALVSCSPQPNADNSQVRTEARRANRAHDLMMGMSDTEQNRAMAQFMTASGERCGRVTRTFYQGSTPTGQAIWNIRCTRTGDWSVMIEPDVTGSTTVTECGALRTVGVRCWRRFES